MLIVYCSHSHNSPLYCNIKDFKDTEFAWFKLKKKIFSPLIFICPLPFSSFFMCSKATVAGPLTVNFFSEKMLRLTYDSPQGHVFLSEFFGGVHALESPAH